MELAEKRKDVIVLDADVSKSTRTNWVGKSPEHFLNMGISERMVGTASGYPWRDDSFVATYGVFFREELGIRYIQQYATII